MKGERIAAEFLALIGMIAYGVILQHIYAEVMNKPDRSWINQGKAWWVTRGSRRRVVRLEKVWNRKASVEEPPHEPARPD